jgi:catechol 2,3-dioxygenase-like lactoylglutathione lyase family enzyme
MRIERVDHVELLVPDRYEAARFYKAIFGFEIRRDLEFWAQDQNGPLMISPVTGGPKLALFDGERQPPATLAGFAGSRLACQELTF